MSPGTTTPKSRETAAEDRRRRRRARVASTGRASTALVISPGIPNRLPKPHPVAAAARAAGKQIICDIELLARAQPRRALRRHHRHQRQVDHDGADRPHPADRPARRCEVGGNIGRGALDLAPLGQGGIYVLELSSYQLELLADLPRRRRGLLNITPDHIDRHGDMAGYVAAKKHIFDRQQRAATAP